MDIRRSAACALIIAAALGAVGCGAAEESAVTQSEGTSAIAEGSVPSADMSVYGYKQISQEEAAEMMSRDDGHIIIDVRRQDEFGSGHIRDAVCIPNETIGTEPPEQLADKQQIILVYCRSGNRSKQAAQKLADMGYANVYEFGGIITWTGDIVTD